MKPHILFVCGRNQWRSPTAVAIYKNDQRIEVRSAGVSSKSKKQISMADVEWADLILVMEKEYKSRIVEMFRGMKLPPIQNLDIPDDYEYLDANLIELIKSASDFQIEDLLTKSKILFK